MKNIAIILILFSAIIISSCSTDVDINADWEPIPVVYGILDKNDTVHYIKVGKAFLGDMPASQMAQISDSLFYNDVEVKLYRKLGNNDPVFITNFSPTDEFPKDSGYFANDRNTIYKAVNTDLIAEAYNPQSGSTDNYVYQLEVIINDIAETVTASTELIYDTYISSPSSQAPSISIHNYNQDFTYRYETGTNGKVFQMTIRFNYLEVIDGDTTDQAISIDWAQPVKTINIGNTSTTVQGTFGVRAFYSLLMSQIPVNENAQRLVKMPNSIEFRLAAGDQDFETYMQVSAPSTGLAQSKPLFTNITNGIGLFASNINIVKAQKLSAITLDTLHRGIYTQNLNFVDKNNPYYLQNWSNN